jgi:hypothetical protein
VRKATVRNIFDVGREVVFGDSLQPLMEYSTPYWHLMKLL